MRNVIIISLVGFCITLVYFYRVNHTENFPPVTISHVYKVSQIEVLAGHEFYLRLDNGSKVKAHLRVETPPEARQAMISFINSSRDPRVVLYDKDKEGFWDADIFVNHDGREFRLVDWLSSNKLVLQ